MTTGALLNAFDTEWIGVIHEQTPKYLSGYMDETIRNRIVLAYLRKYGRIKLGANSPLCIWNVKFDQQPIESANDSGTLNYSRHDLQRQAALDWRGYVGTDMLTEKEYLMNQGPGAILQRYAEIIPSLMESLTDHFGGQVYIDGNASGNENKIHGLESFMATGGTNVVTDIVMQPSDSYAGLSTALANQGGTWSADYADGAGVAPNDALGSDWPAGSGDVKYDFFAPLLVNWSSSSWGTGAQTWEANSERCIRQTHIWQVHRAGMRNKPKVALMSQDMYAGYLNGQESKQRIIIPHRESQQLGFADAINQEGLALQHDFEVAPETAYLFSPEACELSSLDKVLFGYRGPDYSMRDRAYLFYVGFWGNMRFRPKHFAKIKNFVAS